MPRLDTAYRHALRISAELDQRITAMKRGNKVELDRARRGIIAIASNAPASTIITIVELLNERALAEQEERVRG